MKFTYKKAIKTNQVLFLEKNEVVGDEHYIVTAEGNFQEVALFDDYKEASERYWDIVEELGLTCIDESTQNIQRIVLTPQDKLEQVLIAHTFAVCAGDFPKAQELSDIIDKLKEEKS